MDTSSARAVCAPITPPAASRSPTQVQPRWVSQPVSANPATATSGTAATGRPASPASDHASGSRWIPAMTSSAPDAAPKHRSRRSACRPARSLIVDEDESTLRPGEIAEFDTRRPHWFGPADGRTVELLHLTTPHADQLVVRTDPAQDDG